MTSVLLAEDDPAISEPLARALRREGYEVGVAADGPGTLEAARAGGIDLIVLDVGLPGTDGLEICRRLRAARPAVPVVCPDGRADEVTWYRARLRRRRLRHQAVPLRRAAGPDRAHLRGAAHRAARGRGRRRPGRPRLAAPGTATRSWSCRARSSTCSRCSSATRARSSTREPIMREVWDRTGSARPRRWTCTCRGCDASSATTRPARATSRPSAASGCASSAVTDRRRTGR